MIQITIDIPCEGRRDYEIFTSGSLGQYEGHAHERVGLHATRGLGLNTWTSDKLFATENEAYVAAFLSCLEHSGRDVGQPERLLPVYTLEDAIRELTTPTETAGAARGGEEG
jgi:hypothetical protein